MIDENQISVFLTDLLLDILGDGFIPAIGEQISNDNFRKKRERMRDGNEREFYTFLSLIRGFADSIVLLRGSSYTPHDHQQFCYEVSSKVKYDHRPECDYKFYSEAYWNTWCLITQLLNTMDRVLFYFLNEAAKQRIKSFEEKKVILFYITESLKDDMGKENQVLNLDAKEYFTAYQDVLQNWETGKSFFKYPFHYLSEFLKNTEHELEDFLKLWNEDRIKNETINDLRYREIKSRKWNTICPMLYDPDFLLYEYESRRQNKLLNLFDIEVEFVAKRELEFCFVNETEETKKNFELKQHYRAFQSRLFIAYLLNNIYAVMEERGINTEQINELFSTCRDQ